MSEARPSLLGRPPLERLSRAVAVLILATTMLACPGPGGRGSALWGPPPTGRQELRLRWFRVTFLRLAREDARSGDEIDRIGRLVRAMPKLATAVHHSNRKLLEHATRSGDNADRVAAWFAMNVVIARVLGLRSVKRTPDRRPGEGSRRRR